jgi:bacterioferritin
MTEPATTTDPTVANIDEEQLTREQLVEALNGDLSTELQSIAQYVQHVAMITGAEFISTVDELKVHITQEVAHASTLAEQVAFLGGTPATRASEVPAFVDSRQALQSDLALEVDQLDRYRDRVRQATDLGLVDVAEALRPLLTQTQEHVRDLQSALGR